MNQDEFFKIVGILIVSFFIIYVVVQLFHMQTSVVEGLANSAPRRKKKDKLELTSSNGGAGTAASYAATIKAETVKLQDELLISKYRKDYENAIIQLDDYVGYLMLQQALNINIGGDISKNIETINQLNILKDSKDSLNATMTFLDKQ